MTDTLLVLSNAAPGREADYLSWYSHRHLSDMCRVPAVSGGGLFCRVDGGGDAPWDYVAHYKVDAPLASVLAATFSRAGGEEMPLTDAIENGRRLMLAGKPISPRIECADGFVPCAPLCYIALTNATEGEEEAFNSWYTERHLSDVLSVPGFVAAQRFEVASVDPAKPSPWRYLAIYELATSEPAVAMAELSNRVKSGAISLSPMLKSDVYAALYNQCAPRP